MLKKIVKILVDNENSDGFTEPLKGDLKRFIVALTDNVNPNIGELVAQIESFSQLDNINIGGWIDFGNLQDGNDVPTKYIDISTSFDDLETAKTFGKIFNQKAIFDIENFEEIRL